MLLAIIIGLAAAEELNPITRVAQLLEGLAKKVDSDEDAEQELYDKYKCWCKTVVSDKLASIDSNKQKIAELAQYIADLDSGRIDSLPSGPTWRRRSRSSRRRSRRKRTCVRRRTTTTLLRRMR
jgi:hypothetical protein